jgi:hypothetical protein
MPATRQRDSGQHGPNLHILECKAMIEVADQKLFYNNAFRITGLLTNASGREITKHGDRLKLYEELGNGETPLSGAFVRKPPPTLDEIRTALQRLKNPERRIVDEFFWFWPTPDANGGRDEALDAVQQGQANKAISIWRERETDRPDAVVARHNLAIAYHVAALDLENAAIGHDCTEEQRTKIANFWQSSIKRWLSIADDDRLWDHVVERIRQLNEPNLPTGFSRQIRKNLRAALCKIHADLGLAYLECAQIDYAQSQLSLCKQLAQETGADDIAAEIVINPIIARLRQQLDLAQQTAAANPSRAAEAAWELLDLARRMSSRFELLLAPKHPARADLYDDIADLTNRIQITYHKTKADDQTCLEILQQALSYATTFEIKKRIEENIEILKSNISYAKLAPAYALLKSIREGKESPSERLELFRREAPSLLTAMASKLSATDPARDRLWDAGADALRELSVEFWNASRDIASAEAVIGMALELVRTGETRKRLLDDQKHLADIRTQREKNNLKLLIRSDEVEITYDRVRYNALTLPAADIDGLRFGVFKQYTNGINTSTSYLVVVGSAHHGIIEIECKRFFRSEDQAQRDFQEILNALYIQIVPRLCERLAKQIAAGKQMALGNWTLSAKGISGTTGALFWRQDHLISWTDVRFVSHRGQLNISSSTNSKASASFSLRDVWNAPIFKELANAIVTELSRK